MLTSPRATRASPVTSPALPFALQLHLSPQQAQPRYPLPCCGLPPCLCSCQALHPTGSLLNTPCFGLGVKLVCFRKPSQPATCLSWAQAGQRVGPEMAGDGVPYRLSLS